MVNFAVSIVPYHLKIGNFLKILIKNTLAIAEILRKNNLYFLVICQYFVIGAYIKDVHTKGGGSVKSGQGDGVRGKCERPQNV